MILQTPTEVIFLYEPGPSDAPRLSQPRAFRQSGSHMVWRVRRPLRGRHTGRGHNRAKRLDPCRPFRHAALGQDPRGRALIVLGKTARPSKPLSQRKIQLRSRFPGQGKRVMRHETIFGATIVCAENNEREFWPGHELPIAIDLTPDF